MIRRSIPNLFTLGNLYCGFLSIGFAADGQVRNAAILILIGMMLDSMDGRVARVLGVQSQLGKELDSLADIVTFGVAPSYLVYCTQFSNEGILGLAIAGLFPLFGAYRLARFNVTPISTSLKYFTGVPITAAGGLVAFLTLFGNRIPQIVIITVFVALAFLMVSKIKIPSFKDIPLPKYTTIITLFLGYALYLVWNAKKNEWPFFLYMAIPLYIFFIFFQFFKSKKKQSGFENQKPRRFRLKRKP
ncbi:CDP-diacylglycerol--serine O-phosphatidyltransferase [Bacillus sp. EAC]|uniref:CDP-diacylglycerol--serine O-phosphatidyltransferase n=1 Tax=Bacillus sp. EAC TaxID=1978338 RepID=UPI000B451BA8|nr:CDP-diacylglycerol--serine O-phosphatidyltransferase [Bacillus sp. EAC]